MDLLHNPAYAGAFVYGRKGPHPDRRPGQMRQVRRPMEEWTVIHQGVYPAYISWEQFMANQARLADNASDFMRRSRGARGQISLTEQFKTQAKIDGCWTVFGLAQELAVHRNWLYTRIRQ